jgi:hypothetical protein
MVITLLIGPFMIEELRQFQISRYMGAPQEREIYEVRRETGKE